MTKRSLLGLITLLAAMFAVSSAQAQEIQVTGPLAGQPAVRHLRIYREGRIQLQPFIGFTLQDEFSRTIMFGVQANYHVTDWLGIGVWGGFGGVHIDTGLTDQVAAQGQTTDRNRLSLPSARGFPNQVGHINWAAALQATFIPLRGKLALFQKLFVDTDFYLFLGAAAVGVEERANVPPPSDANPQCAMAGDQCIATQNARASRVALAPTFGAGLSLYANQFVAVTLEWRGMPFSWNTSGTDEGGRNANRRPDSGGSFPDGQINSTDRIFHFNHMFIIGAQFYLPTEARVSE